jgi:hypothetical protein
MNIIQIGCENVGFSQLIFLPPSKCESLGMEEKYLFRVYTN